MAIDWWTLGFQTVNVAILIWLLSRFFWKPVAAMIETRREAVRKLTDGAEATRTKVTEALADVETTRAGFAAEREAILAAAHKEAEAANAARMAEAQTEAKSLQASAKIAIDKQQKADTAAWAERSSDLAVAIAGRLAARLDSAVVDACFLDWLVTEIGRMPEAARAAAGAQEMKLEATTATELDAAARKRIVTSIGHALGGAPQITFETDPALIGGIELRGDHLIVNSSWRADLGIIRAGLRTKSAA